MHIMQKEPFLIVEMLQLSDYCSKFNASKNIIKVFLYFPGILEEMGVAAVEARRESKGYFFILCPSKKQKM